MVLLLGFVDKIWGQSKKIVPLNLFTQEDGLASLNVRKIVQDKFGFLWLATQGGLSRFDGHTFVNYRPLDRNPLHTILNNDVADISFSKDSLRLFAVTPYGGVSILDVRSGGVIGQCPLASLADGTPVTVTKCIDDGDMLFIGTDEGYFLQYDQRKQKIARQVFFKTEGKLAYIISNYILFKNRIVIFLSNGEVYQYSTRLQLLDKRQLDIAVDLTQGLQVNQVRPVNDSICGLATNKGLLYYNTVTNQLEQAPASYRSIEAFFKGSDCRDMHLRDNNLWVISYDRLWRCTPDKSQIVEYAAAKDPEMQAWLNEARAVLQIENTLYIISGNGFAAISNIDCPFTAYYRSSDNKVKIPLSYTICSERDSSLIIAASDGIYREYHNELSKIYSGENVNFVAPLTSNWLIASQSGKTFLIDHQFREIEITKVFSELSLLKHDLIISSVNIGDSLFLFASDNANGIYFWYPRKKKLLTVNTDSRPLSLKSNILNRLYPTKDKERVIILCDNQLSVYHIRTGQIVPVSLINPFTSLPLNIMLDICESGGYFWAAVYGTGIVQLDQQFRLLKIYGLKEGLVTSEIYKIIPVRDKLFLSSNRGIMLFNTGNQRVRLFTKEEGLQANEFEEYSGLAANGMIYFGGVNGLTRIDPALVRENPIPPRFYFTHIGVQTKDKTRQIDSSDLLIDQIAIPDNWLQAAISFKGINYGNPSKLSYQYRIRESDTGWIDLGNQDFISLIGMGPGTYHLEARAANEDGYLSEARILAITIEPKWFQTWWFYLGILLLAIAVIYSLYILRVRQMKQQQERLREVRQEIASDLHDDIGSVLNAIKLFAHMAEHSPEKEQHFLNIKSSLKQASEGLRDMIWVLDDNNDSVDELLNRLQFLLNPIAKASAVELILKKDFEQPLTLGKREKRNLLMITKEAVNNSLKYANCSRITIEFGLLGNSRTLSIRDNGQGYSEKDIVMGNGIKNIRYRAKQICYDVQVETGPGKGVAFLLRSQGPHT